MEEEAADLGVVIFYLVFPVIALVVWWAIGHFTERRHLRSLAEREAAIGIFPVTSLKTPIGCQSGATNPPAIVCGEAVVASDGFKSWVFGLKNIVGGESKTFSRLYDRARREAVLRMIDVQRQAATTPSAMFALKASTLAVTPPTLRRRT